MINQELVDSATSASNQISKLYAKIATLEKHIDFIYSILEEEFGDLDLYKLRIDG